MGSRFASARSNTESVRLTVPQRNSLHREMPVKHLTGAAIRRKASAPTMPVYPALYGSVCCHPRLGNGALAPRITVYRPRRPTFVQCSLLTEPIPTLANADRPRASCESAIQGSEQSGTRGEPAHREGPRADPHHDRLIDWADQWLIRERKPTVTMRHRDCGAPVHAVLMCEQGHEVEPGRDIVASPGPGAVRR